MDLLRASDAHDGGPIFLPVAVPSSVQRQTADAAVTVVDALLRLEDCLDRERDLFEALSRSLAPDTLRFALIDTRETELRRRRRFRRPDGHVTPAGFQVLEVNQIAPQSGPIEDAWQRVAIEMFLAAGLTYRPSMLIRHLVHWIVQERIEDTGRPPRAVAVVSDKGYPHGRLDRALCSECERRASEVLGSPVTFVSCFPDEVARSDRRAVVRGTPVDVLWMQYLDMSSMRRNGSDDEALVDVLRAATDTTVVNAPRAALTGSKAALALLAESGVRAAMRLTRDEVARLEAVLPRTISLARSPELVADVVEDRDAWISKASDSYEGRGAALGSASTLDVWRETVEQRKGPEWVYQRFVPPPVARVVELSDDGDLVAHEAEWIYSPHLVAGAWHGTGRVAVKLIGGRQRAAGIMGATSDHWFAPHLQISDRQLSEGQASDARVTEG